MVGASVLVLEDDENLRELILGVLEDNDYSAEGAGSAQQALELAEQRAFDLVISDVRMAGARDGLGALEELKARRPELLCIVITGFTDEKAPLRALKIKVDDFLYKPFSIPELLEVIKRVRKLNNPKTSFFQVVKAKLFGAKTHDSAFPEAQKVRLESLRHYWIALRSKALYKETALYLWDQLQELEMQYMRVVVQPSATAPTVWQELSQRYRRLYALISEVAEKKSFVSSKARTAETVDKEAFVRFYERIMAGQIGADELISAVYVYHCDPERRAANAELQATYAALWGS